jgi:hypothetical protein
MNFGYQTKPADEILQNAIQDANRKILGVQNLGKQTNRHCEPLSKWRAEVEAMLDMTNENAEILLITGVPGWLGNRMIDILINGDRFGNHQSNRKVRILLEPRFKGLLNLPANYEIVYADITNMQQVREAVKNVSTVFHLAGAIYPKNIDILYKVNFDGTKEFSRCMHRK